MLKEEILSYAEQHKIPVMRENTINRLISCISVKKPHTILEIGTAIGYSGIIMLNNAPDSKLHTVEINEERAAIARENFNKAGYEKRVRVISSDALEVVMYLREKFDFILLDGPKGHYNTMLPYLIKILNPGGILFCDNVLYLGLVEKEGVVIHKHRTIVNNMRLFINSIMNNKDFDTELIKEDDGILIAVKKG